MDTSAVARSFWRRFYTCLAAGFEVMARYPCDLTELHWDPDLYDHLERPHSDDDGGTGLSSHLPRKADSGRTINVVPPHASPR